MENELREILGSDAELSNNICCLSKKWIKFVVALTILERERSFCRERQMWKIWVLVLLFEKQTEREKERPSAVGSCGYFLFFYK